MSLELAVRTQEGTPGTWVWTASAGTFEPLDTNRVRFIVPADAAPGSVFRISAVLPLGSSADLPVIATIVLP
jgi:hypothetical protein